MEPEIRTITIETDTGPYPVRAGVYGYVAVHTPVSNSGVPRSDERSVTHVATGRTIKTKLPRELAIRLAELIGNDPAWSFERMDEFKSRRDSLKEKLDAAMVEACK